MSSFRRFVPLLVATVAACRGAHEAPTIPVPELEPCVDGSVCRSGLTCTTAADPNTTSCQRPSTPSEVTEPKREGTQCRFRTAVPPIRNVLVTGFPAPQMPISQVIDVPRQSTTVKWSVPEEARFVTCALFACAPTFTEPFDRGDGTPIRALAHLDRCLLNLVTSPASAGEAQVGSLSETSSCSRGTAPARSANDETVCSDGYVLEELTVGCWASDGTRIVAASALEDVDPVATFLAPGRAADCSRPEHDGLACRRRGEGRLGTCNRSVCAPRCQVPEDCQFLAPKTSERSAVADDAGSSPPQVDGGAPDLCAFTCEPLPGRRDIGVCQPFETAP